jgi:hypothetical protein
VLKKPLGDTTESDAEGTSPNEDLPDSECPAPSWQRQPPRVTFAPKGKTFTYSIRGHDAEVLTANDDEGTE